jgi:predicted ATP-grasp superfamily ATP-dependent carboligase
MPNVDLIILGASARAACFSARRAGFTPYWIDQFGDFDLRSEFEGQLVKPESYPRALAGCLKEAAKVPFMYTGAMENHLGVLEDLEKQRSLLGNSAEVCRAVRNPQRLKACYEAAGIACPEISFGPVTDGTWLRKPVHGAGGRDIEPYQAGQTPGDNFYLQEFIEGESRAAVFLANGREVSLIGVSQQLIGESFLNAAAYAYCGSIGPLAIADEERAQWQLIGHSLTSEFGLRGLFCLDAIVREGSVYPLEINPRYSASVEILELAMNLPLLLAHRQACLGELLKSYTDPGRMWAKAYLFAAEDLRCPEDLSSIYSAAESRITTADIPVPGSMIAQGHPLMTILGEVENQDQATRMLSDKAELLYREFEVI